MTTASSFDRSRKWPKNTKLDSHCYCMTPKCIQHIGCTSEELNLVNCTHVLHSRDLHFQVEVLKNCNQPNKLHSPKTWELHLMMLYHLSATPAVLTILRPMLENSKAHKFTNKTKCKQSAACLWKIKISRKRNSLCFKGQVFAYMAKMYTLSPYKDSLELQIFWWNFWCTEVHLDMEWISGIVSFRTPDITWPCTREATNK